MEFPDAHTFRKDPTISIHEPTHSRNCAGLNTSSASRDSAVALFAVSTVTWGVPSSRSERWGARMPWISVPCSIRHQLSVGQRSCDRFKDPEQRRDTLKKKTQIERDARPRARGCFVVNAGVFCIGSNLWIITWIICPNN